VKHPLTHFDAGSQTQHLQRLDQLASLFESIRSAPLSVVDDLVRDIRTTQGGLKKDLTPVGPWEGLECELPKAFVVTIEESYANRLSFAAYEQYDYQRQSSPVSVIPIRKTISNGSPEQNFNDPIILGDDEDDDDDEEEERMSIGSGSDSSGTVSIMSVQRPAVDVFVERFVDAFSPQVDLKSGKAGAIRAAAGIRMFSPLISDAFEAVSVAFFGRSVQNKQIEASGFRLYPRVLRGLQDALNDPERCKAESTLVTVTLLLAFEVCLLSPWLLFAANPYRAWNVLLNAVSRPMFEVQCASLSIEAQRITCTESSICCSQSCDRIG
jgi:hypothetical protein